MRSNHRLTAAAVSVAMGATALLAPVAAQASQEGRRNTAIGLTAAAAALLLTQKNPTAGIVAGVGAAYAYSKIGHADRDWRDRYGRYDRDRHDYDRYDRDRNDRRDGDRRDDGDRYYRDNRDRRDDRDDRDYRGGRDNRDYHYDRSDHRR